MYVYQLSSGRAQPSFSFRRHETPRLVEHCSVMLAARSEAAGFFVAHARTQGDQIAADLDYWL